MKPNRLQLAITELKGIIQEKDVPTTINTGESSGYVFIGIKSSDNQSGTAKIHKGKLLYAPIDKYEYMKKHVHVFGGLFNGMFNKMIILHDPTMPMAKEAPKKISNQDKGKIKSMVKDGISTVDIAKELALDLDKVEEYASKL